MARMKRLKKGTTLKALTEQLGEDFILNAVDRYLRAKERVRKADKARREGAPKAE